MASVKVKCKDLVSKYTRDCLSSSREQLFTAGEMNVDFEASLDDKMLGDVRESELQKYVYSSFRSDFENGIKSELGEFVTVVKNLSDADRNGDTNAASAAGKMVTHYNKVLKSLVEDARTIVRELIVQKVKSKTNRVNPKQVTSVGTSSFKDVKLNADAFLSKISSSAVQEDITPTLKKSNGTKWLYFGAAATGTAGRVIVGKKPVKDKEIKELRSLEDVPNNATPYEGVIRASNSFADIHFVKKTLKDKDIKQCFAASAPKFGKFKVAIKTIESLPQDLRSYEG